MKKIDKDALITQLKMVKDSAWQEMDARREACLKADAEFQRILAKWSAYNNALRMINEAEEVTNENS